MTLRLWVRRKRGNRKLICSGCGKKFGETHDYYQREVRDLPWRKYQTTVIIELYRVRCPECGVRAEKVLQLPSNAPFSKDFEDAVGLACERASVRQVARQFGLVASIVRAIDLWYLERWSARRRKGRLEQLGVDEIYFGKQMKFITVVSNLETGEPLWFGQDRQQEPSMSFSEPHWGKFSESASWRLAWICGDHSPTASNNGLRTAALFTTSFTFCSTPTKPLMKCGGRSSSPKVGACGVVKGKRWLLPTRWVNLDGQKRQELNQLFALNRRVMKAYLLKESLERLWTYR
jgi:transposase